MTSEVALWTASHHGTGATEERELNETLRAQASTLTARTVRWQTEGERYAHAFAVLSDIAHELSTPCDWPVLLNRIVVQATQLLNTTQGILYLYDAARHELELCLTPSLPTELTQLGVRLPLGEGLAGRVAQTGQPLCIENYRAWPHRLASHNHLQLGAALQAPMFYGGELIGVLGVFENADSARRFDAHDIRLLSLLAAQTAAAVHGTRLLHGEHRRLMELEAISKISTALRTTQTLDTLLPMLLDETLALLKSETGVIHLYDAVTGELPPVVERGWLAHINRSSLKPSAGIVGSVFANGEAYVTREFKSDTRMRATVRAPMPANWGGACVPIRATQRVVGVVCVLVCLPRELTAEEVHLLTTITEIAGNAIQRTQLHEQMERRVAQLAALHEIDRAINSNLDLQLMLNAILLQVVGQLRVDAVAALLFNTDQRLLEHIASCGFHTRLITQSRLRLDECYAGRAASEQRTIHVAELAHAPELFSRSELIAREQFVAYCVVPLVSHNVIKGVLEIFQRTPLSPEPEWFDFLETLANQLAIAIEHTTIFRDLQSAYLEVEGAYDTTLEGWSKALDLRDQETEGHSQRVTELTLRLAHAINMPYTDIVHLRRGALLHDIGKLAIPDPILRKAGPLTDDEWRIMRLHPVYAYDWLLPIQYLHAALDIPYCHHEHWDGQGYPRGLQGEQIPLAARLFAPVDVWDALRSDRPYRPAWPKDKVRAHIAQLSGTHFDPKVVEVFLSVIDDE